MKSLIKFDLDLNKLSVFLIIISNRKLIAGQSNATFTSNLAINPLEIELIIPIHVQKPEFNRRKAEILKFNEKSFTRS